MMTSKEFSSTKAIFLTITDNDEKFIIDLIDRTSFSFDAKIYNDSDNMKMVVVKNEVNEQVKDGNMDEETEEKNFFVDSITPKDEFHV